MLVAFLTFPVWGLIAAGVVETRWGKDPTKKVGREIIEGSILFWAVNIAILDLFAGLFFWVGHAESLTSNWRWFWSWGGWIVYALAIGNGLTAHFYHKDPADKGVCESRGATDLAMTSWLFTCFGAVASLVLWIATTIASAILTVPPQ